MRHRRVWGRLCVLPRHGPCANSEQPRLRHAAQFIGLVVVGCLAADLYRPPWRRAQAELNRQLEPIWQNYEACQAELRTHQAAHKKCGYQCPVAREIYYRHYPVGVLL